ncbi:DNA-binding response regulator, NarL/FixJ family, contains REC and HTH domains [Nitrosospira sp. Nsp14]|uniref:response regulator transcription factor n=1 Tax=Nitrosospira sp. Nsp14 TaxID=1855333 RepID=UPI0008E99059|nr:response regulator transcription factor [Nitrosospira sp. Nsp14]SFH54834.1 DNA-binding response regulator, NarL/FixJ family, contains REC and HTH domains [Nitrosospira sp. Nsp14]
MISGLRGRIAELESELSRMGLALTSEENSHDNWKDRTEGDPGNKLFVTPKRAHPIDESTIEEDVVKTGCALIDSRPLTRISIANLLTTLSDEFVILPYSNIDEFVTRYLERPCKVEMVVFNLGSARISENHISDGILRLKLELPDLPFVFLSDHDELRDILDAIQIGARGYVSSVFNPSTVIQSLRLVLAGGAFIPHNALMEITGKTAMLREEECPNVAKIDPPLLHTLTPRELEVFELVRRGKSNKIIAYELGVQESTVKVHTRKIMTKLKAINRTHAAFLGSQITEGKAEC